MPARNSGHRRLGAYGSNGFPMLQRSLEIISFSVAAIGLLPKTEGLRMLFRSVHFFLVFFILILVLNRHLFLSHDPPFSVIHGIGSQAGRIYCVCQVFLFLVLPILPLVLRSIPIYFLSGRVLSVQLLVSVIVSYLYGFIIRSLRIKLTICIGL